jgi:hypothetical protein
VELSFILRELGLRVLRMRLLRRIFSPLRKTKLQVDGNNLDDDGGKGR